MASFINLGGMQFEAVSLVVGLVLGYIVGNYLGKNSKRQQGMNF